MVISRVLIYGIVGTLLGLSTSMVYELSRFSPFFQMVSTLGVSSFWIVFAFRLRKNIQLTLERKWISDSYDPDQLIGEISSTLALSVSREEVFQGVSQLICDALKLSAFNYVFFQSKKLKTDRGYIEQIRLDPEEEQLLAQYLATHRDVALEFSIQFRELSNFLGSPPAKVILPIYSSSKPEGILLFNRKISGAAYSHREIQLLDVISRQCSLTLDRILLYEKVAWEYEEAKTRSSELEETFVSTQGELEVAIQWVSSTLKRELGAIKNLIDRSINKPTRRSDNYDLLRLAFETINGRIDMLKGFQPNQIEAPINEIIVDILRDILPMTLEKKLVFMLDFPQNKVFVREANKLKICIRNLIENAVFHSPLHSTIGISTTQNGDFLAVTIADQGAGMGKSPEHEYSTGQGLSICRAIMDQIGGEFRFFRNVDGGTSIYLKVMAAGKEG